MLPEDMQVGEVWHHPIQRGPLPSTVCWSIKAEGRRRCWYVARVAARSWKRCADQAEMVKADKQYLLDAKYNATYEDMEAMRKKAGGACRICLKVRPLHIDHCHDTGLIRGLLCVNCNTSLGKFEDSPARLRRAADYLDFYAAKHAGQVQK